MSKKLKKFSDIDKNKVNIPKVSIMEMEMFRMLEKVFNYERKDILVYQCDCGIIFTFPKQDFNTIAKNLKGEPICYKCGNYMPEEIKKYSDGFNKFAETVFLIEQFKKGDRSVIKKLQEITGKINFSDIYVEYKKMIKKNHSGMFHKKYRDEIDDLWTKCEKNNPEEFLKLLTGFDSSGVGMGIYNSKIDEISSSIDSYRMIIARLDKDYFLQKITKYPILVGDEYKTEIDIKKEKMRLMLLIYSHIIELSEIYNFILNLENIARGKKCKDYYKELKESHDKNKNLLYKITKKILSIPSFHIGWQKKLIKKIDSSNFKELFNKFLDLNIRNSFYHSDYQIVEEDKSEIIFKMNRTGKIINFNNFRNKYELCVGYLDYIISKISDFQTECISNGKSYKLPNGNILTVDFKITDKKD